LGGNGNGGVGGNGNGGSQGGASAGGAGGAAGSGGTSNKGGASGSGGSSSGGAGGSNGSNGGAGGGSAGAGNGGASGAGGTSSGNGGSTVAKSSCGDGTLPTDPKMPGYPDHTKFAALAATTAGQMSPTELAGQMRGTDPGSATARNWNDIFRQPDNTTRSIKGYTFRDGPRGVNLDAPIQAANTVHGNSTAYPVAAARGASWDTDLEFRIGQALGNEMVAAGQTMLLAPTVNILRHPLWGRAQETYGEDSFLLGRMGAASVAGIQQYVGACVKHYAANNNENLRATKNASMDEQTLREIYTRHFEMIIKDGGVACVMAAYNQVNGTNCTQNTHLLTHILRNDYGFQGFVMSDWWAIPGGNAGNPSASVGAAALSAGLDMELPWNWDFNSIDNTSSGVTTTQLQTAAKRILEQKYRFNADKGIGLKSSTATFSGGSIANPNTTLAAEAAQKSMVLLKNSNNALPIASTAAKIAVLGAKTDYCAPINSTTGAASGPGINNCADDVNNGTIDFANGIRIGDVGSSRVRFTGGVGPCAGIKAAAGSAAVTCSNSASDAAGKDVVVVVAGLTPYDEGEEYNGSGDRSTFALDGKPNNAGNNTGVQNKLITDAVTAAAGKPVIVVLEGGSVIDMPWLSQVSAVVMAWYPGMAGGTALGQLLFGKANFSGKLPITWPSSLNDLPTFNGGATTTMDYYLGYRYFDNAGKTPLYAFGYGLSYTKFAYSNLVVPCGTVTKPNPQATPPTTGGVVNVSVDVTNTGTVAGDEVVLLFTSYPSATNRRSAKELKGFARVSLAAGAKQTVTIPVRVADLKYWNKAKDSTTTDGSGWLVDSGPVKVMVGGSSDNLPLSDTFTVN
jgi:beta-glucosidase